MHEPYESVYFRALDTGHADAALRTPIDLDPHVGPAHGDGTLVKEISFQIGPHLDRFLDLSEHPVVFLLRDPRLTVSSRRRVREQQRTELAFPLVESGWQDIVGQIEHCRERGRPYLITDSADFRARPAEVFARIHAAWGLPFAPSQLSWQPRPEMALSNYRNGGVDHFFTRVLSSSGIEPPVERPTELAEFPQEDGLREHVAWALSEYDRLRADRCFLGTAVTGR